MDTTLFTSSLSGSNTGLSPSMAPLSRGFFSTERDFAVPHLFRLATDYSGRPVWRSVALTSQIKFFSFPAGTRMF